MFKWTNEWINQWIYDTNCDHLEDKRLIGDDDIKDKNGIIQIIYENYSNRVNSELNRISTNLDIQFKKVKVESNEKVASSSRRRRRRRRRRR